GPGVITDNNGPSPSVTTQAATVDQSGYARWYIFSTTDGTMNLTFSDGSVSGTGIETWDVPDAGEGRTVGCSPHSASNGPGAHQVVTCTVTDGFGNAVAGVQVAWSAQDSGGAKSSFSSSSETDATGQVQATVTSSAAGQTSLTASLDPGATECGDASSQPDPLDTGKPAGVCSDSSALTWTGSAASSLALNPAAVSTSQFLTVKLTASLTGGAGHAHAGVPV